MVHLICLAHGLHHVAEEICLNYPDVDKLISIVKKIFIKAPLRVKKFKQDSPSLPLPPQPILTRWDTWLNGVEYYCENYEDIKKIVSTFDSSDASSIKIVQESFSPTLLGNLASIKSNYGGIMTAISRLETVGLELHESLGVVKNVEFRIGRARGNVAISVKNKLTKVLNGNDGYATMRKISDILNGDEAVWMKMTHN